MNQDFQKKRYDLEEVRKLWWQEPDDNRVFRAATEDIEEYPPEIQTIIKEEAERRHTTQDNTEPIPKQTMLQKGFSSVGLYCDPEETKDLESANQLIRLAFWTAVIGASITLVLSVVTCFGYSVLGLIVTPLGLVHAVVIFALAYGIHKRSRTCAVITFVYFVVSKIVQCVEMGNAKPIYWGILFGFLLFQGIRGTFAYHRLSSSVDIAKDKNEQKEIGESR
jgi:hypothetical protein